MYEYYVNKNRKEERVTKEVGMIYTGLKTCILFFSKPYPIPRNNFNNFFFIYIYIYIYIYSCSEIKMIENCRIEDTY